MSQEKRKQQMTTVYMVLIVTGKVM